MNIDRTIFTFRRHVNVLLYPSQEELADFLSGPTATSRNAPKKDAIDAFQGLIDSVGKSEKRSRQDPEKKVFAGVLSHARFANTALAAEVANYFYFLEQLKDTDIRKPSVFVRAAEEEIAKLDPRQPRQAERLARLRALSDERKRELEDLIRRREALCAELSGIARYVRENLAKIEKICRTSVAVLSDAALAAQVEHRLGEDLKAHFRHTLKTHPDRKSFTLPYLQELKREVAMLGEEIIAFRRDAVIGAQKLYQSLLQHIGNITGEIDGVLARLSERNCEGDVTDQILFSKIEEQLIALLSDWKVEYSMPKRSTSTPHHEVFIEKEQDAVDSLFNLVAGERRSAYNRRNGMERRLLKLGLINAEERRTLEERRGGKDRREAVEDVF